jgi:hypothetical protein
LFLPGDKQLLSWKKLTMRKSILVIFLAILFSFAAKAQQDSLRYTSSFFSGSKFYHGDRKITLGEAKSIILPGTEAYTYLQKGRSQTTIATVLSVIGGALVGYEVGKMIGGGELNGGVIGAGAAFIAVSIPFEIGSRKNLKKAAYSYNASLR